MWSPRFRPCTRPVGRLAVTIGCWNKVASARRGRLRAGVFAQGSPHVTHSSGRTGFTSASGLARSVRLLDNANHHRCQSCSGDCPLCGHMQRLPRARTHTRTHTRQCILGGARSLGAEGATNVVGPHGCPRGRGGHLYPGPTGPGVRQPSVRAPCLRIAVTFSKPARGSRRQEDDAMRQPHLQAKAVIWQCRGKGDDHDMAAISKSIEMGLIWLR